MNRQLLAISVILLSSFSVIAAQEADRGILIGPAPRTEAGGQRWALIVGINDYTNVPALRYGRSDAEALAGVLVNKCGFPKENVILMTDAPDVRLKEFVRFPTRGNLRARINQIAQVAKANDLLLISFSGHGTNIDGRGYLMPVDGDARDIGSLVPLSWVKETLESSSVRQRLLLLDACHSGARAVDVADSPAAALLSPLGGAAFVTLASCDSDQLSHEDPNIGRGVFTDAVIEGLQGRADSEADGNRDSVITATELFGFASLRVEQWSLKSGKTQTPVLRGEFKGRIELARFKTIEELKSQREQLQSRLTSMQDKERTSAAEELKKEIAELEAQLNTIIGATVDGVAASDEIQMAYVKYDAAKKQVVEIEALLAETLKTYQPTSSVVAKVKERLRQAQAGFADSAKSKTKADEIMYRSLENQIQSKQAAYEELVKEVLPTAPHAQKIRREIDDLTQRQTEFAREAKCEIRFKIVPKDEDTQIEINGEKISNQVIEVPYQSEIVLSISNEETIWDPYENADHARWKDLERRIDLKPWRDYDVDVTLDEWMLGSLKGEENVVVIKKKEARGRIKHDLFVIEVWRKTYELVVDKQAMAEMLKKQYRYTDREVEELLATVSDNDNSVTVRIKKEEGRWRPGSIAVREVDGGFKYDQRHQRLLSKSHLHVFLLRFAAQDGGSDIDLSPHLSL